MLYNTSGYLKFRGRIEHEDDENLSNIINGCMINTEMPNYIDALDDFIKEKQYILILFKINYI